MTETEQRDVLLRGRECVAEIVRACFRRFWRPLFMNVAGWKEDPMVAFLRRAGIMTVGLGLIVFTVAEDASARISREQALGQAMSDFQKRDYKNAVSWFSKTIWYCIDEKKKNGWPMEEKDYVMGATAYLYRGLSFIELKQRDKAKIDFENAEQLSTGIPSVRTEIGNGYLRIGSYDDAVRVLGEVVEKDPGNGQAHYYLARVHYKKRNYDLAWKHLKIAQGRGVPSETLLVRLREAAPGME
jgi:tetratricopeptide (TPR) repeat protein